MWTWAKRLLRIDVDMGMETLAAKADTSERWLRYCLTEGAEWHGPKCARCGRNLIGCYTMRVTPEVIDMVCPYPEMCG